jgi:thiamine biosynthesis lipoprotein
MRPAAPSQPPATFSLRALGTTALVVVAEPEALPSARRTLLRQLRAVDLACSRFRPDSDLVKLNHAGGAARRVGPVLWDALEAAVETARATGGLVDPTIGKAMRLAGYDRTFSQLALRDGSLVVASFIPGGRWAEIELDPGSRTVRLPVGVELDLGASAKALTADRVAREISESTDVAVLVSLGGDIAVAGSPPEGGWVIALAEDHSLPPDEVPTRVSIESGGLASSGIRVRRWRTASGEQHHILDPRTGRPARSRWTTVTVAAASCLDANAASTAAIVLGDRAPEWLSGRGLPSRLVHFDGRAIYVCGFPADLAAA